MSSVKTGERSIDVINGKFNEEKDEILNSVVSYIEKGKTKREKEGEMQ